MSLHRSSAWPLTWVAMALVVYATLHPWQGWIWPEGAGLSWTLPRHRIVLSVDLVGNLLGYIPLGAMWCVAWLRSGRSPAAAAVLTVLGCSLLSYLLEQVQLTLPMRVPSMADWTLNTLGAAWGVLAALTAQALGLIDAWQRWRERWFIAQAGAGLALLWLWPLGLLFPPPLPLAQGQLWPTLHVILLEWAVDTPFLPWLLPDGDLLGAYLRSQWPDIDQTLSAPSAWQPVRDAAAVSLGLLAPMSVACALARPPALRLVLLVGAWLIGVLVTTLSTAMNYGPEHALTWVTLPVLIGLLVGPLAGAMLVYRTRTTAIMVGMLTLCVLVWLVHQVPADPYYAQALQAWENGRFIRFHGMARWFGLLWPFVAFVWLVRRLLAR